MAAACDLASALAAACDLASALALAIAFAACNLAKAAARKAAFGFGTARITAAVPRAKALHNLGG